MYIYSATFTSAKRAGPQSLVCLSHLGVYLSGMNLAHVPCQIDHHPATVIDWTFSPKSFLGKTSIILSSHTSSRKSNAAIVVGFKCSNYNLQCHLCTSGYAHGAYKWSQQKAEVVLLVEPCLRHRSRRNRPTLLLRDDIHSQKLLRYSI